MKGKNVLITGATAGIGLETAINLARMGASVHFIARNKTKAIGIRELLIREGEGRRCNFYIADLSSQKSIRDIVPIIQKDLKVIDVLINNAGAVFSDFSLSQDGIEMTMATNHFSYFLLTNLLLDQVKASKTGRIINVSSGSNRQGKINFESFTQNVNYQIIRAYCQSKLANILFTKHLSELLKDSNVTVNCLHPGRVRTDIGKKNTGKISAFAWSLFLKWSSVSVEKGAETSIYLASSPEVNKITGTYFSKCQPDAYNSLADDEELQRDLWAKSLELCPVSL
ncbi:MAG TPA: SDR family oxidoreductase [Chitinophagales bacterium]|nr:SDR family oxidoreductase [Chitinophagales bacterium]